MLKGVQPYAIKGALWYQGESITTGGTAMYTELMNLLIASWRQQWGQGEFPFYFVQLASLDNNSNRPEVREAQARSLSMPNTAMAVTTDIGNKSDVHPHDKQTLGARLAMIARARDYGEKIEYSGPTYESMKVEGNKIRIAFGHSTNGLKSKGEELKMFEIAGADGNFVAAKAVIEGRSVIVSAESVSEPKAVRYAWNRWANDANLYNSDGLPAAQFRTDAK
jgi:sialate O-acetylesterase